MIRKLFLVLVAMSAITAPSYAQSRYQERPPAVVSPDLAAPWVAQVNRRPIGRQVRDETRYYQQDPRYYQPAPREYERYPRQQEHRVYREERRAGRERQPATRSVPQMAAAPSAMRRPITPQIDPIYLPQQVAYQSKYKKGTIVIDTRRNFLYLVEGNGQARRYGVGTGKPGFEWAGTHKVTAKKEWPDWRPPAEMIKREKAKGRILPAHMPGGEANPLGARALYLGSTLYRIHGTNQPWTIGQAVSSGCIRMRNEDVIELYNRVPVGASVVVI
ncbi:L,D-transpeptidase [Limoniibacter endophyticus]|uniref:L,D-transpeptidase n=1 Tax=Limoniibacter endophyticus TaxID=1565040 RepID=A0A8J3GFM5_9HYPH|nr:L,D-transpeptidase [Limoniibacter endophyticus]GHC67792.1 L,D-transpeptidase [Limoniibacter endophyticus]